MRFSYIFGIFAVFNISFTYSKIISDPNKQLNLFDIPDTLLLGAATSAFQVEGAVNVNGRSDSYMDWAFHNFFGDLPDKPNITSDSYHNYKKDVEILEYVGLSLYRFSVSWSRILPTGYADSINENGLHYYHALLDELEKAGVEPVMTLNHWDHPQSLEEIGGWQNDDMVQAYADYARLIFKEFGNRVKIFLTFNEPNMFCINFQTQMLHNLADGVIGPSNITAVYNCAHNILKAHAEAYHIYDKEFRTKHGGRVGMNLLCENFYPQHPVYEFYADLATEFSCDWFANPIFSESGDYPKIMKQIISKTNMLEGFNKSTLPSFSVEWIKKIKGSADFFGLSHYSSHLTEPTVRIQDTYSNIFMTSDARISISSDPNWVSMAKGLHVVPQGLRNILKKLKTEYNSPTFYITECGYGNNDEHLDDQDRIKFIYSYLREVLKAIQYDGCDIRSFIYWSLIDSHEFQHGFDYRYGLAHIDFNDPSRKRTLRKSAHWLREVVKGKQLFIED